VSRPFHVLYAEVDQDIGVDGGDHFFARRGRRLRPVNSSKDPPRTWST
jgi:hypothetical protein